MGAGPSGLPPEFSVIVPTHRRRELLDRLLVLLREQPGPSREVIVVDDASSDGTSERRAGQSNPTAMPITIDSATRCQ